MEPEGVDGVFGVVRRDGTRLAPSAAQTSVLDSGGWAHGLQEPDGMEVAGTTHLVGGGKGGGSTPEGLKIVAELYRRHGTAVFEQLHGQFCIALYDQRAQRLLLATDRFATRPIYYSEYAGTLRFGTSLNRIVAGQEARIAPQAILEYLLYSVIPAPRTPFEEVQKLCAGHVLTCDRSGIRVAPYWDMAYPESRNGSVQSWARQLRVEIESAIGRWIDAEGSSTELGAFLSGGTDSSTVSGMIGKITGRPPRTFSIGYAEAGYDELAYARTAARWFGAVQQEWKLSPREAFDALPGIVAYYEEPFGNASALPTFRCAQLAREHGVTVLFAGDGGDELFAGNTRYGTDKVFALYQRIPHLLRRTLEPMMAALPEGLPILDRAQRYIRRANIPNPRRMFSYDPLLSEPLTELLTTDFLAEVRTDEILAAADTHYNRPASGTSELNRLLYVDLKLAIADNDVRKVSGMTELAGVEVRYPFLDTRLVEFSGQIPTGLKLRRFEKRYIFKQALADFLPPEVLSKTKHGFGAPIAVWMRSDPQWHSFIGDLLHDARTRQRGYIAAAALDRFWDQLRSDGASFYGDSLWPYLMLELWHRKHVDGAARDSDAKGRTPAPVVLPAVVSESGNRE